MSALWKFGACVSGVIFGAVMATCARAEDNPLVPEDTCIVEFQLPAGATVSVDGRNQGKERRLEFPNLKQGTLYARQVTVAFQDGTRQERELLLRGGQRVRLALQDPGRSRPGLVLQTGHAGVINFVGMSPDGRYVLTVSGDEAILWDAATGQQINSVRMRHGLLAVSRDCQHVLSRQADNTAVLSDLATSRKLHEFQGHAAEILAASFSRDGHRVLTGSVDKTAILWDAATGQKLRTLEGHTHQITSVSFSLNGQNALTASQDAVILWDAATGRKLRTFQGHKDEIEFARLSPDDRHVVTVSSEDQTVILWDVATGRKLWDVTTGRSSWLTKDVIGGDGFVTFSPDGQQILICSYQIWNETTKKDDPGFVILYDVASGQRLRTFEGVDSSASCVAFSPDGRQFLIGVGARWNETTKKADAPFAVLWDVESGRKLRTFEMIDWDAPTVAFSPDGRQVLTGGHSYKTAISWDVATGRKLRLFQSHIVFTNSLSFSPNGRQVVVNSAQRSALWDLGTGQLFPLVGNSDGLHRWELKESEGRKAITLWNHVTNEELCTLRADFDVDPSSLVFSPDGQQVLTWGSCSGTVVLWNAATGEKLRTFEHDRYVVGPQFSPDGRKLLSGTEGGMAIMWDVATGEKLLTLELPGWWTCALFSADGRRVLTGSADSDQHGEGDNNATATVWDAATGKKLATIPFHSEGEFTTRSVAISPDGRQVLTASDGHIVILWDAVTGRKLRTFQGHEALVDLVLFTPDSLSVLTGARDGTTRLWDIATGQELVRLLWLDDGMAWLVATPEGLFDASTAGRQRIGYRVGGATRPVPVDRFFLDFYRPGLLASIWRGERPLPVVELGKSLPPIVRILSPTAGEVETAEATLEVQATDQGGGVANLALFQNGARVLAPGQTRHEGKVLYQSFRVGLVEGENQLRITAASRDGSWESEPAELMLRYERPLAKSRMFVLAVGINKYADANYNLNFAAKDAQAMAEVFRRRAKRLYEHVSVTTLTDQEATRIGIKSALQQLAAETRPQDTLVLFLAGHGMMIGQRYYFLPYELHKEAESLEADIRKQALPGEELGECLVAAPALKRVMILDTCASGGALALLVGKSRSGEALRGTIERLSRSQGVFAIAATGASEQAEESKELGHGILTYSLLAGLKAIDAGPLADQHVQPSNPERVVNVLEWFTFADGQVRELTEKLYGAAQDVQFSKKDQSQSFPLLPLDDK